MSVASSIKKTLESLPAEALEGQRALVRVDFNVPMANGNVADDTRIRASLKTIEWLKDRGCRVVLLSHMGRPKGTWTESLSLRPVAQHLETLLGAPVVFIEDGLSEAAVKATRRLRRGEVALVENTRFAAGEEKNDAGVAEGFAKLGDFFVNDAFGVAHRAHASNAGVAKILSPSVAGFLLTQEIEYLGSSLEDPKRPYVAVLGGAKISGKIDVIDAILPKVDKLLIGGAMACTFFKAQGFDTGNSLVETEKLDLAKTLIDENRDKLVLPSGARIGKDLNGNGTVQQVPIDSIPTGWAVYDIDDESAQVFAGHIRSAATVLWNGPMGVFETPPFDQGTLQVAQALAEATANGAVTIVGGGDSAAAVAEAGLSHNVSHVSTGGGASLEFLEGKSLPGIDTLTDA